MTIANNLIQVRQQIQDAEKQYQRPPGSTTLLAASKQHSVTAISAAYDAGQRCFGESYIQEAIPKIEALPYKDIEWHFIGRVQANKTRLIANHFAWVHSVDHIHLAKRLNEQRPPQLHPLNICIQVNMDQECTKSGVVADDICSLAQAIQPLTHLRLRGLMAIPRVRTQFEEQLAIFSKLQNIYQSLCTQGLPFDTLSMGMSQDFVAAIACGSTLVRIGTSIFGARNQSRESSDLRQG